MTTQEEITETFRTFLRRDPTAEELSYYVTKATAIPLLMVKDIIAQLPEAQEVAANPSINAAFVVRAGQ